MDQVDTLRRPPRPGSARGPAPRYRSQAPHHRRRRRALGLAFGGVVLILLIVIATGGGGGGQPTTARVVPAGFFTRINTLAGSGVGSFAAAQAKAENAAIDRTLASTPYVLTAGSQHREMALTFDDGPGPYTLQLLAVLQRYQVPATFFEVGSEERYFHAGTSAIVAAGDPIGDHTQDHLAMNQLSVHDQQSQLTQEISATGAFGASYPRMFRPPYGAFNNETLALAKQMKMLTVLWTIDTEDFKQPGVDAIAHTVLSGARPGAIVLMHDAGGTRTETIAALPQIIQGLRSAGYTLVTVPKLLLDNPAPPNQNVGGLGAGG